MTSATGSRSRLQGFSILEVLIVLGIIALFAGFFMVRFDSGRSEELLMEAATDLKSTVLKSKKRSYAFRRNQYIIFAPRSYWTSERPLFGDDALVPSPGEESEQFQLPAGVSMQILPPGATKWFEPKGHVWTFRASGLSDPIKVRFTFGESFSLLDFNVLTGLAEEESAFQ